MFCPIPWIGLGIRNNGDVRVCCQANQGPDKGLLKKEDGTVYNAENDDLNESRNCKKMKDIRLHFLKNKWHPECIRCSREESSGMESRYTYEKTFWNHLINEDNLRLITKPDGEINTEKTPVAYYDLRFGNKCNLKCRICGPTDSSFWYGDYSRVWGVNGYNDTPGRMKIIKVNGKYQVENNIYEWYKSKQFWDYMEQEIPNIEQLHMVGGEPMLIDEQFKFLKKCIEKDRSRKMTVEHNSNVVYIPDEAFEIWKHFKCIKIGASIDGVGKVNEYIRYPSKWNNTLENLHKLDRTESNCIIWLAYTVGIYNILHIPEFFKWKIKQDFKKIGSPIQPLASLHPVHSPFHLNCKVLPIDVKHKIIEHFRSLSFNQHEEEAIKLLKQYSNFMLQQNISNDELIKFFKFNNKLDLIRNQSLKESIPNLYKMIKEYDKGEY